MDITPRGIVIGLPAAEIEADVDLGRLVRRQARLLGRATSARSETSLQRDIDDANRRIDSVIRRIEAARRRPDIPPELLAEVEKFERGPQDHRYRYRFVELSDVPQDVRDAVSDGVKRACNRLEGFDAAGDVTPPLPTPTVRYFRAAKDGEPADFTDRRRLFGKHVYETNFVDLRIDDISAAKVRQTAAHECYHWAGRRDWRDEAAADRFAAAFVA